MIRYIQFIVILACLFTNIFAQYDSSSVNLSRLELGTVMNSYYLPVPEQLDTDAPSFTLPNPTDSEINYKILGYTGLATLGVGTAVHLYQKNTWWATDSLRSNKFRVINDWEYALWLDKVGHFYATTLMAHGFKGALEAADMNTEMATWYSAALAFGFEMFIEIEDGYGLNWGFSPGDATADFLGACYHVCKYYYPSLNNFQFRVSYFPSEKYRNGEHDGTVSDDYLGQKYWLSLRMENLLPNSISEVWPDWLMLAVGMGVRNLDGRGGGDRDFYIALDFDAEEIPLHGRVWSYVKNTLNLIHFPMPGIRINNGTAFFVICY